MPIVPLSRIASARSGDKGEGSNIGVRRRQMQALLTGEGYDALAASGMS